jgi:hypothetical protein
VTITGADPGALATYGQVTIMKWLFNYDHPKSHPSGPEEGCAEPLEEAAD